MDKDGNSSEENVVQYTANEVKEVVRSVLIDVGKLRKYDEGG